jgi:ABC-type multidrug transport system permease subunit
MKGLFAYAGTMLRLQFRSRLAVFYGFLFPLIFLVAFRILYRWDTDRGASHLGAMLVVAILGGTCFGLPVTMVSERERGVWRRYRLLPTPIAALVGGTMGVRFVLLAGAGLLQLLLALVVRMPAPNHWAGLALAFAVVSFTFCSFGLIVAMLTSSVQAAQALGQCIFLPMLALGGVARSLRLLPGWTQTLAAFTPGRYAVDALTACATGEGIGTVRYEIAVLLVMGIAAGVTAARMFRWDVQTGHERGSRLGWLAVTLGACLLVGFSTLRREAAAAPPAVAAPKQAAVAPAAGVSPAPAPTAATAPAAPPAPVAGEKVYAAQTAASWQMLRITDLLALPRDVLPPDTGVVTPIAAAETEIDENTRAEALAIYGKLSSWEPGKAADPVQRVTNLLNVPAVIDVLQTAPLESFAPIVTEWYLREVVPAPDLVRLLCWVSLHPVTDLVSPEDLQKLGIGAPNRDNEVRGRLQIYAAKFMFRLLDDPDSGVFPPAPAGGPPKT